MWLNVSVKARFISLFAASCLFWRLTIVVIEKRADFVLHGNKSSLRER